MSVAIETGRGEDRLHPGYRQACRLAVEGRYEEARRLYGEVEGTALNADARLRALVKNDLAALSAWRGGSMRLGRAGNT